ncbi:MAG: hypothetical protein AAB489_06070 [Patescibacteria group bacterium]
MPLTPQQLQTGIAYFTLLAQIDRRLQIEDAAHAKEHGKEPARTGESLSPKHHDFTP